MTATRVLLLLSGIWLGWYGMTLVLELGPADQISLAWWFAAGILLHDAVLAPLCAGLGLAARRILPVSWWAPVTVGAVCTLTLAVLSIPVVGREDANPANPTVLDRNFGMGLLVAIGTVWTLVAFDLGRRWYRARH
ncbi:hypothetical protein BOX37_13690 [Nocardia mangyaensis]|uniref:Uncharacterized protein n=1 Tax=Nocardia mangyaensis TaxID=2213200 RepID=A0A1J0VS10_9NOCA|nr:hypothetical protein [Nocardia mangyaensis]APE34827.1 hypothetical protein BOX37_13690 [Nocardia mangyaensis]